MKDGASMSKRTTAIVAAILVTVSCGGPLDPSENITERFSGTVQLQNVSVNAFDVQNLGEFKVVLTSLTPGNVPVGAIWGQTPDGVNCSTIQPTSVTNASVGKSILSGAVYIKGKYCVELFDPALVGGSPLNVPQTYALEVSHP